DDVAQGLDPGPLAFGEIAQHMRRHHLLDRRLADADAHALVVVADVGGDRAQAVVPGDAAADLHPHFRRGEIDLVVEDDDVADGDLVEARGFSHRATGLVHEGARQQQQYALARDIALDRDTLEFAPERTDVVALGDRLDRHEADVVAIAGVARAGIAEADEEQHGVNGEPAALRRYPGQRKRRGARAP